MRKIFTTSILSMMLLAGAATTAQAQETIVGTCQPASGYIWDGMVGNFYVFFDETLDYSYTTTNAVNGYVKEEYLSKIHVTIDGVEVNFQNDDNTGRVRIASVAPEGSRTQMPCLLFVWPSNFFGEPQYNSFNWKGVLNVTIDEGFIQTENGTPNAALSWISYVYEDINITPTWKSLGEDGSTSFEQGTGSVSIVWEGAKIEDLNRNFDGYAVYAQSSDGSNQINLTQSTSINDSGDGLVINLNNLPVGSYTLNVHPAGVIFEGQKIDYYDSPEFSITITKTEAIFNSATVTPESGTSFEDVEDIETITLSWGGSEVSLFNPYSEEDRVYIEGTLNGIALENLDYYFTQNNQKVAGESGTALVLDLSNCDLAGGFLKLTIPYGFVNVKATNAETTQWNEEISLAYNLEIAPNAVINPVSGSTFQPGESFGVVSIMWPGSYFTTNTESNVALYFDGKPVLENIDLISEWNMEEVEDYNGDVLKIDLSEIVLEEGEYVLKIPAETVELTIRNISVNDDEQDTITVPNDLIEVVYVVEEGETDGISSILGADKDAAVYNLQGVKVNSSKLGKGLYIINGKKVLVK